MRVVDGLGDTEITEEIFPKTTHYIRRLYISMYNRRIARVYVMQSKRNLVEHCHCRGLPLLLGFEVYNLLVKAPFANWLEDVDVMSCRPTLGAQVLEDMILTSH
jgi:hypothetical protein